jgi:hypothetical protein
MSNEHEFYFGCALFERVQDGESYYFSRTHKNISYVFEVHTHMETHWILKINGQRIQFADVISPKTLKHVLIGLGFLKSNPSGFINSVMGVQL